MDGVPPRSISPFRPMFSRNGSAPSPMSWSEFMDYIPSPSHKLHSSLHDPSSPSSSPASRSPAAFTPGSYNHIHSLEKDFCSNFSCCGLTIADMHELLDHFEEAHVVVIGKDGRTIYPSTEEDSSTTVQDARARGSSSIVISYPQPHPPLPMDANMPPPRRSHTADVLDDFDPYDMDGISSNSSSTSRSSSTFASPSLTSPTCLPPALLTLPPSSAFPSNYASSSADVDMHDATSTSSQFLAPPTLHPTQPRDIQHRRAPKANVFEIGGRRTKILDPAVTAANLTSPKKPHREKAYKCPHPGCSKTYLNPNGLKYHLEKGTCTINAQAYSSSQAQGSQATGAEPYNNINPGP